MDFDLVVSAPFEAYPIGARITDPVAIATILASPKRLNVVQVSKSPTTPPGTTPVPAILVADEILLRRQGVDRLIELADFEAFLLTAGRPIAIALAALVGGGQAPSGAAGTLNFSAAANSGLIAALAA